MKNEYKINLVDSEDGKEKYGKQSMFYSGREGYLIHKQAKH